MLAGSGIRCYVCNSIYPSDEDDCLQPTTQAFIKDCNEHYKERGLNYTYCRKSVQTGVHTFFYPEYTPHFSVSRYCDCVPLCMFCYSQYHITGIPYPCICSSLFSVMIM